MPYITAERADILLAAEGNITGWSGLSDAQKAALLERASRRIDALPFAEDDFKRPRYSNADAGVIPLNLAQTVALLALWYAQNPESLYNDQDEYLTPHMRDLPLPVQSALWLFLSDEIKYEDRPRDAERPRHVAHTILHAPEDVTRRPVPVPVPTSGGGVNTKRYNITSDEVAALHTTPYELVPAPDEGYIITPVSGILRLIGDTPKKTTGRNFQYFSIGSRWFQIQQNVLYAYAGKWARMEQSQVDIRNLATITGAANLTASQKVAVNTGDTIPSMEVVFIYSIVKI